MNSVGKDKGEQSNLVSLSNGEMKQYFDWGGIEGKGIGLRFGSMTKQIQTSHDTTEHCSLGAIGLLISSLWMWNFPLCSHPGMWSSSLEYQVYFPTFNTWRTTCPKGDGNSFDHGNYMLTQELVNHPWFLPKLARTSWDTAFSVRCKQVTDFRLESHPWNCEHWLPCGKIRLKRKLQKGPFP